MRMLLAILGIIQSGILVDIRYKTLGFHTAIRQYFDGVRNVFSNLQKKKKKCK